MVVGWLVGTKVWKGEAEERSGDGCGCAVVWGFYTIDLGIRSPDDS